MQAFVVTPMKKHNVGRKPLDASELVGSRKTKAIIVVTLVKKRQL